MTHYERKDNYLKDKKPTCTSQRHSHLDSTENVTFNGVPDTLIFNWISVMSESSTRLDRSRTAGYLLVCEGTFILFRNHVPCTGLGLGCCIPIFLLGNRVLVWPQWSTMKNTKPRDCLMMLTGYLRKQNSLRLLANNALICILFTDLAIEKLLYGC